MTTGLQTYAKYLATQLADCISMDLTSRVDFTKYYYYLLFIYLSFIYYLLIIYLIFIYYLLFIIYYLLFIYLLFNYLLFIYY